MYIEQFRIAGIRCFEDTGRIHLSPKCNVLTGQNNAGKSTVLKAFLALQGSPFVLPADHRRGSQFCFMDYVFRKFPTDLTVRPGQINNPDVYIRRPYRAPEPQPPNPNFFRYDMPDDQVFFGQSRPNHAFIPFLARRKTQNFDQNVNRDTQQVVQGTLSNLYSRIDLVATAGHPRHEAFKQAVQDVIGIPITTKSSQNGKEAGFYLGEDDASFVTLDRMGDGVSEMVALLVELSLEKDRIFLLEEPETNIHPKGLKAVLEMIRKSSEQNQFIIATHSNIVVRELGANDGTKIFNVFRDDNDVKKSSRIEEVERNPAARFAVLRSLGYDFADMELHEAWLFLEESSAERIIEEVLIPHFAPALKGRLRTFSAGGANNVAPSVSEFQRLIVFVHLQQVYKERIWVRADGDEPGIAAIKQLHQKFDYLTDETCACFKAGDFELYYPEVFKQRIADALAIGDKHSRRKAKLELLNDVLIWSASAEPEKMAAWGKSAEEVCAFLKSIETSLAKTAK